MPAPPTTRYRFGTFEADAATGELRRQGLRIKLPAQPFQVLCLLLDSPAELLTREAIARELWPDGTFVDFDHGVNSAVNRIREALGDTASSPRFIETLARRGYRFIAPVERFATTERLTPAGPPATTPEQPATAAPPTHLNPPPGAPAPTSRFLASPSDLPTAPPNLTRTLFLIFQAMYLGFYVGALCNLPEIDTLLAPLPHAEAISLTLIATAATLIPARAFILSMVLFRAPRAAGQFLRLWPFLLPLDTLWSLAPFLLLHHIDLGVALACTALLAYSPFAQRSLILMGGAHTNCELIATSYQLINKQK